MKKQEQDIYLSDILRASKTIPVELSKLYNS